LKEDRRIFRIHIMIDTEGITTDMKAIFIKEVIERIILIEAGLMEKGFLFIKTIMNIMKMIMMTILMKVLFKINLIYWTKKILQSNQMIWNL
jgi:hypothetical protein